MRIRNAFTTAALMAASFNTFAAGTSLEVTFDDPVITCAAAGGSATVTFAYTLVSTGSADSAVVTAAIDGGSLVSLATVASGNITDGGGWTFSKNIKSADGTYTTSLLNGTHSVEVCATQSGATGNNLKSDCSSQTVAIDCQVVVTDPCNTGEVFGKLQSSAELCKNNSNVATQFKGSYGPSPILSITGPNGFIFAPTVNRSGQSCVYTYNWDPRGNNGGAGTYTFKLEGNGNSISFSEDLTCKK